MRSSINSPVKSTNSEPHSHFDLDIKIAKCKMSSMKNTIIVFLNNKGISMNVNDIVRSGVNDVEVDEDADLYFMPTFSKCDTKQIKIR